MSKPASAPVIESLSLSTQSGDLELLSCIPSESQKSPILCLHGAFCSAEDYRNFLPFFASHGYPSYSLSLRGHGKSWAMSWVTRTLLTSLDNYVEDIMAAADCIKERHPEAPPIVLIGHSFGGGHMQYLLAQQSQSDSSPIKFGGLVLLAAAPLSGGGKEIMANWERVEAPNGYKYPWSPRSQLDTPDQVRAAFFQPDTPEDTITRWLSDCKTANEGIRTGLSVFWPFGTATDVLKSLVGIEDNSGQPRKVLLISGSNDCLVTPPMVEENAKAYRTAVEGLPGNLETGDDSQTVISISIPGSAHHLMMDITWEDCALRIVNWMEEWETERF
jgi:pimeloyl-ACP methyl ester carboxylesterase